MSDGNVWFGGSAAALFAAVSADDTAAAAALLQSSPHIVHHRDAQLCTALFHARSRNTLRALIDAGAALNAVNARNETTVERLVEQGHEDMWEMMMQDDAEIRDAVRSGDEDRVFELVVGGFDPATVFEDGWNALHLTAVTGSQPIMEIFIEALLQRGKESALNAVLTQRDKFCHLTPLDVAVIAGRTEIIPLLLTKIHFFCPELLTSTEPLRARNALHLAAETGNAETCMLLLSSGVYGPDGDSTTDLHGRSPRQIYNAIHGEHSWRTATRSGTGSRATTVGSKPGSGKAAGAAAAAAGAADNSALSLLELITSGNIDGAVQRIRHIHKKNDHDSNGSNGSKNSSNSSELHQRDASGMQPIHWAAHLNQADVITELLRAGVSMTTEYGEGKVTPLVVACHAGSVDAARVLLDQGADPNLGSAIVRDAPTPLCYVQDLSQFPNLDLVQLLLSKGANPNARDNEDLTALHHAAASHNLELARILVAAGADRRLLSPLNETPLLIASGTAGSESDQAHTDLLYVLADPVGAAIAGDEAELELINKESIDTEAQTQLATGKSSLLLAVELANPQTRLKCTRLLLTCKGKGGGISKQDDDGNTPLHIAATHGDNDLIALLTSPVHLTNPRSVLALKNKNGKIADVIASELGHIKSMELLVNAAAQKESLQSRLPSISRMPSRDAALGPRNEPGSKASSKLAQQQQQQQQALQQKPEIEKDDGGLYTADRFSSVRSYQSRSNSISLATKPDLGHGVSSGEENGPEKSKLKAQPEQQHHQLQQQESVKPAVALEIEESTPQPSQPPQPQGEKGKEEEEEEEEKPKVHHAIHSPKVPVPPPVAANAATPRKQQLAPIDNGQSPYVKSDNVGAKRPMPLLKDSSSSSSPAAPGAVQVEAQAKSPKETSTPKGAKSSPRTSESMASQTPPALDPENSANQNKNPNRQQQQQQAQKQRQQQQQQQQQMSPGANASHFSFSVGLRGVSRVNLMQGGSLPDPYVVVLELQGSPDDEDTSKVNKVLARTETIRNAEDVSQYEHEILIPRTGSAFRFQAWNQDAANGGELMGEIDLTMTTLQQIRRNGRAKEFPLSRKGHGSRGRNLGTIIVSPSLAADGADVDSTSSSNLDDGQDDSFGSGAKKKTTQQQQQQSPSETRTYTVKGKGKQVDAPAMVSTGTGGDPDEDYGEEDEEESEDEDHGLVEKDHYSPSNSKIKGGAGAAAAAASTSSSGGKKQNASALPTELVEQYFSVMQKGKLPTARQMIAQNPELARAKNKRNQTSLHIAVATDNVDVVQFLLKNGADIDARDGSGQTPAILAASVGGAHVLKILIDANADLMATDDTSSTALHAAVSIGAEGLECLELLLAAGARCPLDAQDNQGMTALHIASKSGHLESVKALIQGKGKELVRMRNSAGLTAGEIAEHEGHDAVAKLLQNSGRFAAAQKPDPRGDFTKALQAGDAAAVGKILQQPGVDPRGFANMNSSHGAPVLVEASRAGHHAVVIALLDASADPNAIDPRTGESALFAACTNNDLKMAELLIQAAADPNIGDTTRHMPLHAASENGNSGLTELLLGSGAQINARDSQGNTALHLAARARSIPVIKQLLQHGIDPSVKNKAGQSAYELSVEIDPECAAVIAGRAYTAIPSAIESNTLCDLVRAGDLDQVKRVLANGADPNMKDSNGNAPIHLAVKVSRIDIIQALLGAKANIDIENRDERTSLLLAARLGNLPMVKFLLEKGADLRATDENGLGALHLSAYNGYLRMVEFLVEEGLDVDEADDHHNTALHLAAAAGKDDVIKYLLAHRADLHMRNLRGQTPYDLALDRGHPDSAALLATSWKLLLDPALDKGDYSRLRKLLDTGYNVNLQDGDGNFALHHAVILGDATLVRLLLDKGADLELGNRSEQTPLILAARLGGEERDAIVKMLVDRGAQINAKDRQERTALHFACSKGNLPLVKYLLSKKPNIDCRDDTGQAPLHAAAHNGSAEVVHLLLDAGADPAPESIRGRTPLDVAIARKHNECAMVLREATATLGAVRKSKPISVTPTRSNGKSPQKENGQQQDGDEIFNSPWGKTPARKPAADADADENENEDKEHQQYDDDFEDADAVQDETEPDPTQSYMKPKKQEQSKPKPQSLSERSSKPAPAAGGAAGSNANAGADPAAFNSGKTVLDPMALFECVRSDDWAGVSRFIKNPSIDINGVDSAGFTPIHRAIQKKNTEIVRRLLEAGARLDIACRAGRYPIHDACKIGDTIILNMLIGKTDVALADTLGRTGLHYACMGCHPPSVRLVLGTKPAFVSDKYGRAPRDVVPLEHENRNEVLEALDLHQRKLTNKEHSRASVKADSSPPTQRANARPAGENASRRRKPVAASPVEYDEDRGSSPAPIDMIGGGGDHDAAGGGGDGLSFTPIQRYIFFNTGVPVEIEEFDTDSPQEYWDAIHKAEDVCARITSVVSQAHPMKDLLKELKPAAETNGAASASDKAAVTKSSAPAGPAPDKSKNIRRNPRSSGAQTERSAAAKPRLAHNSGGGGPKSARVAHTNSPKHVIQSAREMVEEQPASQQRKPETATTVVEIEEEVIIEEELM